eukprot:g7154.t1
MSAKKRLLPDQSYDPVQPSKKIRVAPIMQTEEYPAPPTKVSVPSTTDASQMASEQVATLLNNHGPSDNEGNRADKTKKDKIKKSKKRFLWSNALHMRFLMSMFDWGLKNIDGSKIRQFLNEEPKISLKEEEVEAYLKALRDGFRSSGAKARESCEREIRKDYLSPTFVQKSGTATNFTEYPVKLNYIDMIEKGIPILSSEPDESPSTTKCKNNGSRKKGLKKRRNGSTRKRTKLQNSKDNSKSNYANAEGVDSSALPDFEQRVNDMDLMGALFDDDNMPRSTMDSGNNRRRDNSFSIDDVFTPSDVGEVRMQYKLHREMMRRHTENIIRYGGYEELPDSVQVLEDSISADLGNFDITQMMDTRVPLSKNTSKSFEDNNISTGINSLDGQATDITTGQARSASNSWSFVDSPAISSKNFSIITENENNKDDNLFDFLLDD